MKGFGKIIFGIFVVIVGMFVFNTSKRKSIEKALKEQVAEAYEKDDYTFFHQYYDFYKNDPVVEEKGYVAASEDTRPDSENKEIKFDLYIYAQAIGTKKNARNIVTIVLTNLEMENADNILNAVIKTTKGDDHEALEFNLQKIDTEQKVYFTSIYFDQDNIEQLIIYHPGYTSAEPIHLFDTGEDEKFMAKDDYDIATLVKEEKKLEDYGVSKKGENTFKVSNVRPMIAISVYIVIAAVVTYLMYFRQRPQGPVIKPQNQHNEANVNVKPSQENINVKNIKDTEERDDVKNKK